MEQNRKLNISVSIEGIQLQLKVASVEEEKIYRDAASLIQGRIQKLRSLFPQVPSEKHYYVMAMLNTAVDAVRTADKNDTEPLMDALKDLETEIDNVCKK